MPLDEQSLRRPEFRGGSPIVLADGQEWIIPVPSPLWTADDSEEGVNYGFDLGPEFDALSAKISASTTVGEDARAIVNAARHLLNLNYDLSSVPIGQLLSADFRPTPEGKAESEPARIGRELSEIVAGVEPPQKPRPVGDA